jgi:hypothetical protein
VFAPEGLACGLISTFGTELSSIFPMPLAMIKIGPSRPWSDRHLFSVFNSIQHHSTIED